MEHKEADILWHAKRYGQENGLDFSLSYEMPAGYETANGMYEPKSRTVFINRRMLESLPAYERLFYLYHELRHAAQYLQPERFVPAIVKSLDYVIGYDGECWRRRNGEWKACHLKGTEAFFTQLYLAQPHEMDANTFAYQQVKAMLGDSEKLQELYTSWMPAEPIPFAQYQEIYAQIDRETEA